MHRSLEDFAICIGISGIVTAEFSSNSKSIASNEVMNKYHLVRSYLRQMAGVV